MGKRYYWLKLKNDFFQSKEIKKLRTIAGGDTYTIIYLKMMLYSLDKDGLIEYEEFEDTLAEEIALAIDERPDNVGVTLQYLLKKGLAQIVDGRDLMMTEVLALTGSETDAAERVRRMRANKAVAAIEEKPDPKTNAERQRAFRAKKSCEAKQHIPMIDNDTNRKRYGGNYFLVCQRDKYRCAICDSIENLCVHHIDGYDPEKPENNSMNKMVMLCRKCHSQVHAGTLQIPQDVLDGIDYEGSNEHCSVTVTEELRNGNTEIEKEKEIEKEIEKSKKAAKPQRHKYGMYENVLLSDEEMEKLKTEFPDWESRIDKLSEYMRSTGKSYKDHLATIRAWARKDKDKPQAPVRQAYSNSFHNFKERQYDYDDLMERIRAKNAL